MSGTIESRLQKCIQRLSWNGPIKVLQVGAGDGKTGDHLHSFLTGTECDALLLEPVTHIFEKLRQTYADYPRVTCMQLAVSESPGCRPLYRVGQLEGLPWWADQLASFDRSVVMSHVDEIPNLSDLIVTDEVDCVTPAQLIDQFQLKNTQLLAIDTEGHDGILVRAFLAAGLSPQVILFEHKHLTPDCRLETQGVLTSAGYRLLSDPADTLGCSKSMNQLLTIF